jgi:hypothetical protein
MLDKPAAGSDQGLDPDDQARAADPWRMCDDLWLDAARAYSEYDDAIKSDARFGLKLDHWKGLDSVDLDDPRALYPVTADLYDMMRHKWSAIARSEIYIECESAEGDEGEIEDLEAVEDARAVIESVIHDPLKRYKVMRRRMVMGGIVARAWDMAIDWRADVGQQGGEVVFRTVNPTKRRIAPGWSDEHDPTCPWVAEEFEMRLSDVRKMGKTQGPDGQPLWKNTELVKALGGTGQGDQSGRDTSTLPLNDGSRPAMQSSGQKKVRFRKFWFRFDESVEGLKKSYDLPPDEQFMWCRRCEQADATYPRDELGQLPEQGGDCPRCREESITRQMQGLDPMLPPQLERISAVQESTALMRYPHQGRMVIYAVNQPSVVVYDGGWPCPLRSFPYMRYRPYDHMEEPFGLSDTALHKSSQMMLDVLMRSGYHQMIRNQDVILTKWQGLFDSSKQPFEFSDEHGAIAYWEDPLAAAQTKHFQGSGVSPGLAQFFGIVQGSMNRNRGSEDLGLTQEQSRDIPVGTVERLSQVGEIPVQDAIDVLHYECEAIGFGVILDMCSHYWDEARAISVLGPDGVLKIRRLRGADIPNVKVIVSAAPTIRQAKLEQWQAFERWLAIGQVDPAAQLVGAQFLGVSPSLVRRYQSERQRMMEGPVQGAAGVVSPPRPGSAAPAPPAPALPPTIAARMNGIAGG